MTSRFDTEGGGGLSKKKVVGVCLEIVMVQHSLRKMHLEVYINEWYGR